jgi:hypothetical protein
MEKPLITKLDIQKSPLDKDEKIKYSTNIEHPKFNLGFHHFIHDSKSKTSILNHQKKNLYRVIDPFEHKIEKYNKDIKHKIEELNDKLPLIQSRGFYKLWEILFIFDVADYFKKINCLNIFDPHLGFNQSILYYRYNYIDKKIAKTDNYYNIPLYKSKNEFVDKFKNQINIFNNSSDITNPKDFDKINSKIKDKMELITAEGGQEWENENVQEQEAYFLIISQIILALSNQKKDGHFVLKIYETFTNTSYNIISLLSSFYQYVYLYKPYTSRSSNSEKYIIAKHFKFSSNDKAYNKYISKLIKIHKEINDSIGISSDEKKIKIYSLFPDYEPTQKFKENIRNLSINIANKQQIMIGKIIEFVEKHNDFGDVYQKYKSEQIKNHDLWVNRFIPSANNFKTHKKELKKLIPN